jgi:serine O-acetyltransferase
MSVEMDDSSRFGWLVSSWREDLVANRGQLFGLGFQALAVYRFGRWCGRQEGVFGWVVGKVYTLAFLFVRNVYGVEIPQSAVIGRRLWLPHAVGLVISPQTQIGDDCMIRQSVTIGRFGFGRKREAPVPKLGNNVMVGPGAVIVGGVTVGDGARIGPNAVVMTDVPAGASAFVRSAGLLGSPGRGETSGEGEASTPIQRDGRAQVVEVGPGVGEMTEEVEGFIRFLSDVVDLGEEVGPDSPLLSTGIVDSFDVTALLGAIEDRYEVVIDPEEVDVDTFDTPTQMLMRIEAERN